MKLDSLNHDRQIIRGGREFYFYLLFSVKHCCCCHFSSSARLTALSRKSLALSQSVWSELYISNDAENLSLFAIAGRTHVLGLGQTRSKRQAGVAG
jgi:hypothetical protein